MHVCIMIKKCIPFFIFFVTAYTPLFSASFALYHTPEAALFTQINSDSRFPAKIQIEETAKYGVALYLPPRFGLFFNIGFSHVHPSSLADGVQYRGYAAFFPGIGAELFFINSFPKHDAGRLFVLPGLALQAAPRLAWYTSSDRAFFYISVGGSLFLDLVPASPDRIHLRISVPVLFHLRPDLQYSIAPGLSFSFYHRLYPGPPEKTQ